MTIRWLMLHTHTLHNPNNKKAKAVRDMVMGAGFNPKSVFSLLLNTAQYEFVMKEMFSKMLDEKQQQWDALRHEGSDRMKELSDVFGGNTPLSRVEKNTKLQSYVATPRPGALCLMICSGYGDCASARDGGCAYGVCRVAAL